MPYERSGPGRSFPAVGVTRWDLAAFAWGLAESTFFVLVPDVLLTAMALKEPRRAQRACLFAVAGALLGGGLMYTAGLHAPEGARRFLLYLPGIHPGLLETVRANLQDYGLMALFLGPLRGIPYKIYATLSGAAGIHLLPLMLVSIPARLLRFSLLSALAGLCGRGLRPLSVRWQFMIHGALWTGFYAAYFILMGRG